jgi:hypothetical protein
MKLKQLTFQAVTIGNLWDADLLTSEKKIREVLERV